MPTYFLKPFFSPEEKRIHDVEPDAVLLPQLIVIDTKQNLNVRSNALIA